MKLTPLLLFLLLLVVLVIAITTLKNPIQSVEKEGFVQFKTNVVPQTETVVPPYSSRSIVKLYDNLFVDRQNLNIVEVVSSEFIGNIDANTYNVTRGNVDLIGSSITAINVQIRDGTVKNHPVTSTNVQESDESKVASIPTTYKLVPYYTSACATTAKYQLFYVPWGTDTYIHGIQVTATPSTTSASSFKPLNLYSYYIPSDKTANMTAVYYQNNVINLTVPSSSDNSVQNGKLVTEPLYSTKRQVYQLSSDIKYDINSGNVIVNSTNSIVLYDRSGKPTIYSNAPADSVISTPISDQASSSWIANNVTNTTQIVYIPSAGKTVILLLQKDAAGRFNVLNSVRFNKSRAIADNGDGDSDYGTQPGPQGTLGTPGPQAGPQAGTPGPQAGTPGPQGPPPPGPNIDPSAVSDYYKWYWYWNSTGPGTNAQYSNNYLLKTQIVPPVCPACPNQNCASTDKRGNGTSNDNGNVKTDKDGNIITDTVDTAGNVINKTVDTAGNVINKTVHTTSNLLTSGATGATNLLTAGATGATNLLTAGASGTVDLLKDTGSGIVSVADKTLNATGDIIGDLTSNPNNVGGSGAYYGGLNTPYGGGYRAPGFSRGYPPVDNYSYYGALSNKGSNYIPITADFSAFKK
uniref:Uncharacterized protein n=1 Tax=viral metagenome TaxID=1070528 RepID=A0A6C0JYN7_9ZZZZ